MGKRVDEYGFSDHFPHRSARHESRLSAGTRIRSRRASDAKVTRSLPFLPYESEYKGLMTASNRFVTRLGVLLNCSHYWSYPSTRGLIGEGVCAHEIRWVIKGHRGTAVPETRYRPNARERGPPHPVVTKHLSEQLLNAVLSTSGRTALERMLHIFLHR
jgi:hypothetical protein